MATRGKKSARKKATRKKATGKRPAARKRSGSSGKRAGANRSARKASARGSARRGASRKRAGGRGPVARVKRVTRQVVEQATVAVSTGVDTLRDLGENLVDRVRSSGG